MRRALAGSVLFHVVVVALAYFGLPAARLDDTALPEPAMTVDLVAVAEQSNVPPAAKAKEKVAEAEKKPAPPQPAPPQPPAPQPAPEPAKPAPPPEPAPLPPEPQPPEPQPAPPQPAPAPKVEKAEPPVPEPQLTAAPRKPKPPPAPEPAKIEPKEEAKAKEEPKKAEPRPEPKTAEAKREPKPEPEKKPEPAPAMDFAAVLKSLQAAKTPAEAGKKAPGNADSRSDAPSSTSSTSGAYDSSLPVTMSEIDMVRRQIEQCWNLPGGAKNAQDLIVTITVEMNPDGTPRTAAIADQAQMQSNPFYRVAAESALRAVLNPRCHPFKLPREKYERWKSMTLVFNPKEMFGT